MKLRICLFASLGRNGANGEGGSRHLSVRGDDSFFAWSKLQLQLQPHYAIDRDDVNVSFN